MGWQLLDGFNEIEGLDSLVGCILGRMKLEHGPRLEAHSVIVGPWVRSLIPTTKELQDGDPTEGGRSDAVSDRDFGKAFGTILYTSGEVGRELISDLFRDRRILEPDLVLGDGVLSPASGVHDVGDGDLPSHDDLQDTLDVRLSSGLPLLGRKLWETRKTTDHEEGLAADVLLEV